MSSPTKRSRDADYADVNKKYKETDECQLCGNEIQNDEGFQHCKHAARSHKKCLKQWIIRSNNNKCLQCFQSYTDKNLADIGIDNSQQHEDNMRRQRLQRAFEDQRLARDDIHQEVLYEMEHQEPIDAFDRHRYDRLRQEIQQRRARIENMYARDWFKNDFIRHLTEVFRQINANNIENILNRIKTMYQEFNLNLQLENHEKTYIFNEFYKSNNEIIFHHISDKPIELIFNIHNTDTNSVTFTRFETGLEDRYTYEPIHIIAREAIMPFSCLLETNNVRPIDVIDIKFNGETYNNKYIFVDKINKPELIYGNNHPFILNNGYRSPPLIIYDQFMNLLSKVMTRQATVNSFIRLYSMQTYTMHVMLDAMSEPYIHGERNNNSSSCAIMGGKKGRGTKKSRRKNTKKYKR